MNITRLLLLILLVLISALPSYATDSAEGKRVYEKYCSWCHGIDGAGDGPAAPFLNPPPRDLTYGLYKWKSTPFSEITPSDRDFRKMITGAYHNSAGGGLNGTAMPGWQKKLSEKDIQQVIAYIKDFSGLLQPEEGEIDTSVLSRVSGKGLQRRGRELFKDNCAPCHGLKGRGDGEKKLKDDFGARTWPRNLTKPWTFRAGATAEAIYTRITVGIPGTQMPSFADPASRKVLSDEDRARIARYVVSLAAPYKRPGGDALVNVRYIEGALPDKPGAAQWDKVKYSSFALFPQMVVRERHFTPTVESISLKALYNENEVAFLLEWDDATKSEPGDLKAKKLASGRLYRDMAALQFPLKRGLNDGTAAETHEPPLAMGDERDPVRIWLWKGLRNGGKQEFSIYNYYGYDGPRDVMKSYEGQMRARGFYDNGTWTLIIKAPRRGAAGKGLFVPGEVSPIAFALWDGSNGERGSIHTLSSWLWISLDEPANPALLWPLIVLLLAVVGEFILLRFYSSK